MHEGVPRTLTCPNCNAVLRKHGPDQGICPHGHGIIKFTNSSEGVVDRRLTIRQVYPPQQRHSRSSRANSRQ